MKQNIKITVEYDGTDYCGWQIQKNLPTIQGMLKKYIYNLTGEEVTVYGSGRTDSGVHAYGQVANFHVNSKIPAQRFAYALNSKLPTDIVILQSCKVDDSFHAQFCTVSKAYEYKICNRKNKPALEYRYSHWEPQLLDIETMREASNYLIGTYDFSAFESANSPRKSSVRTINYIDIKKQNCYIQIQIEANGFLYHMVRNIVGSLINIGKNKYDTKYIKEILKSKNRDLSGPTVPAKGLYLKYVKY